jgi:hypothetical protein
VLTAQAIAELRGQTGVSSLDAVHALSVCGGRIDQAVAYLMTSCAPPRTLLVTGSRRAVCLAEGLVRSGLRFECEQLGRDGWRFSVAPAGYPQLLALHGALLADENSAGNGRERRPAGVEQTPAPSPVRLAGASGA